MMQDTSLEAFESSDFTATRQRIYNLIREHHGLTIFRAAKILGKPDNRISGRFTELRKLNLIRKSTVRLTNPETGKHAILWVISN